MAMKFEDLPPLVQNQLKQMQQLQQQLELVVQQRLQLDARLNETKNALEELEKLEDDSIIYKSIGTIIVRAKKDTVLKNLKEDRETASSARSYRAPQAPAREGVPAHLGAAPRDGIQTRVRFGWRLCLAL